MINSVLVSVVDSLSSFDTVLSNDFEFIRAISAFTADSLAVFPFYSDFVVVFTDKSRSSSLERSGTDVVALLV